MQSLQYIMWFPLYTSTLLYTAGDQDADVEHSLFFSINAEPNLPPTVPNRTRHADNRW